MEHECDEPQVEDQIRRASERLDLLDALVTALTDSHAVLQLILESRDPEEAVERLREAFGFDVDQALAVLDAQFRRVTKQDRSRILQQRQELAERLTQLRSGPPSLED